jgi:signal transduction histidine kinase
MNLSPTPTQPSESVDTRRETERYFSGRWLVLARVTWIVVVILALMVVLAGFVAPQDFCGKVPCSIVGYFGSFAYAFILSVPPTIIWIIVGVVLFLRKSEDRMVWLVSLTFVIGGVCTLTDNLFLNGTDHEFNGPLIWQFAPLSLYLLKSVLTLLTFAVFPNGRFVPRWTRWVPFIYLAYALLYLVVLPIHLPGWMLFDNPVNAVLWFGCEGCLVVMQLYRFARRSGSVERQQIKWILFSFVVLLVLDVLGTAIPNLLSTPLLYAIGNGIFNYSILIVPFSLMIALLRYRLWDIDIIINRTLVYGTLTACIVGLYAVVVGTLSTFLQAQGNFLISLLATGLVAVVFHPLREQLQQLVNRLFYGQRDEPYSVISQLGSRLEATLAPEQVLSTIAETTAQALKLPYVALVLEQDEVSDITTSYGTPTGESVHIPLLYQTEQLGKLLVAPRSPGDVFGPVDRRLLEDLARQAGVAVYAVRLTINLQRLASDLQSSRALLVTTREEERRRLRRDLHDGLGSVLASLNLQAGAISALLLRDRAAAETLLEEQQHAIRTAIADIRRLVYTLRPPSLDELGLLGALRERAAHYTLSTGVLADEEHTPGLQVAIEVPKNLPPLPAAVEVATYRIVQEALANVARHSQASNCWLHLSIVGGTLQVEVTDNGVSLPLEVHEGVGLLSMHELAAELGGRCHIQPGPKGGTQVRASLPFLVD